MIRFLAVIMLLGFSSLSCAGGYWDSSGKWIFKPQVASSGLELVYEPALDAFRFRPYDLPPPPGTSPNVTIIDQSRVSTGNMGKIIGRGIGMGLAIEGITAATNWLFDCSGGGAGDCPVKSTLPVPPTPVVVPDPAQGNAGACQLVNVQGSGSSISSYFQCPTINDAAAACEGYVSIGYGNLMQCPEIAQMIETSGLVRTAYFAYASAGTGTCPPGWKVDNPVTCTIDQPAARNILDNGLRNMPTIAEQLAGVLQNNPALAGAIEDLIGHSLDMGGVPLSSAPKPLPLSAPPVPGQPGPLPGTTGVTVSTQAINNITTIVYNYITNIAPPEPNLPPVPQQLPTEPVTFPALGTWWTPLYPDGFKGAWDRNKDAILNTPLMTGLQSLVPSFGSGTCPAFSLPNLVLGGMTWVLGEIPVPCWIYQSIGLIMMFTAAIISRRLIFGG